MQQHISLVNYLLVALIAFTGVGCVTSGELELVQNDLFRVQKRLLELERQQNARGEKHKVTERLSEKKISEALTAVQSQNEEFSRIKGEIDTLRMAVLTGEIPGNQDTADSIAKDLGRFERRLLLVEEGQVKTVNLLTSLRDDFKRKTSGKKIKAKPKKSSSINTMAELRKAFEKKQFGQIARQGEQVLAKLAKKDRALARWYYSESMFRVGRFRKAVLTYNDLLSSKLLPGKEATLRLRIADSFKALGDKKTARIYYSEIMEKHPDAQEASFAQDQLTKL